MIVPALALGILAGCGQEQTAPKTLARVGSVTLTEEQARAALDTTLVPYQQQVRRFVTSWVTTEMLYQEAVKKGIEQKSDLQQRLNDLKKQLTVQEYLQTTVYADTGTIAEDTLSRYYEAHKTEFFVREDMMKLNIIGFAAREQASMFASKLARGTGWENAFKAVLDDPEISNEIVFISTGAYYSQQTLLFPELWKVAQTLGENDVSFPVHAQTGYFIIQMLSSVRKNASAPFDVVRDEVRLRLLRERQQRNYDELVGTLRSQYSVELLLPPVTNNDTIRQTAHD